MLANKYQTKMQAGPPPWHMQSVAPAEYVSKDFEKGFGEFLIAEKIIDYVVLERAVSAARKTGERLDRVLTKLGMVPEVNLAAALS